MADTTHAYPLARNQEEQERLIRQAMVLDPFTERLFRDAGIGRGQRVLDLGSGVGDVAFLAARLVGPSGEVLGVERDLGSVVRARARATDAGLLNVSFTQADVGELANERQFDAAVGRFILTFVPDPVAVLRLVSGMVRPGGVLAFQEPSYAPFILLSEKLPLWSACVSLIQQTLERCGANTEMGFALHRAFQDSGLPAPAMRLEMPLGNDPEFIAWVGDTVRSLLPKIREFHLSYDALGDLDTLAERLQNQIRREKAVVPWQGLVAAWSRKPDIEASRSDGPAAPDLKPAAKAR